MSTRGRSPRADRVEVKRTRKGRALRIDGTFASWYQPGTQITDSVWDALAAPLLLLPRARRRHLLILGLGGGSAARVARALAPSAKITGVELDPKVVRAARRWFDLDELRVDVVQGDALHYLERAASQPDCDLLTMASSLHWTDFEQAISEFVRVLRPGGVFAAGRPLLVPNLTGESNRRS